MGRTLSNDVLQQYMFSVEIEGMPVMAFREVTGLAAELDETIYAAGGQFNRHKLPGRETVDDIVLNRGIITNTAEYLLLFAWYKSIDPSNDNFGSGGPASGMDTTQFRRNVTIIMQDRYGNAKKAWILKEAWIKRWEGPDLEGDTSDVAVESVTIAAEEIDIVEV